MGIDYLVCPQCEEGFPDCNGYHECYVCNYLSACYDEWCKKEATFKYKGREYILCKECYPYETKTVKVVQKNDNYKNDLKAVRGKIDARRKDEIENKKYEKKLKEARKKMIHEFRIDFTSDDDEYRKKQMDCIRSLVDDYIQKTRFANESHRLKYQHRCYDIDNEITWGSVPYKGDYYLFKFLTEDDKVYAENEYNKLISLI